MKNPPTLADACVVSALDRKAWGGSDERSAAIRQVLLMVPKARKFVLDVSMSRYLADMTLGYFRGGQRQRIHTLDNLRRLARLPHALTWIELDCSIWRNRLAELSGSAEHRGDPYRFGWLLQQHPHHEAAFRATEIYQFAKARRVAVHPLSAVWCGNDDPSPWRSWSKDNDDAEFIVAAGYSSTQVHLTTALRPDISNYLIRAVVGDLAAVRDPGTFTAIRDVAAPLLPLTVLWGLLATLNDLPVVIETVTPSRGYVARGSYKRFLEHSIIRLTVPETRWRSLARKTAALIRRRAHQVRGHFRRDWRHPLALACDHLFDDTLTCLKCNGHKLWIAEHTRGDASLGFVTHDFERTRGDEAN